MKKVIHDDQEKDDLFQEDVDIHHQKRRKSIRMIAIIILLCFGSMVVTPVMINLNVPSLQFLKESFRLNKEPEIQKLRKCIATITVENRKGTGFNIDEKGLIVTNAHVVQNAEHVFISFYQGKNFQGTVIEIYPTVDLAIIQVDGGDLPKLELEQNFKGNQGDKVLIIGNPLEYSGIANKGVIKGNAAVKNIDVPVLLIEAPVNKGNSGSPVINEEGNVVGVIFATINLKKSETKLGAAIPIQYIVNKLTKRKMME